MKNPEFDLQSNTTVTNKENFFVSRVKKYPVLTFTLAVLFSVRFVIVLILYFTGTTTAYQYSLSTEFLLVAIPLIYLFQWLIATWVASKFTRETLRNKFYRHPIATIIFAIFYALDLPYRLAESDLGSGLLAAFNIFEIVVYYAFTSFVWWLLVCWISQKIWKTQKLSWSWYNNLVNKIFAILPPLYKFVLGSMVALLIFLLLFLLLANLSGYSGADLQAL
jgi:hypothetical protein